MSSLHSPRRAVIRLSIVVFTVLSGLCTWQSPVVAQHTVPDAGAILTKLDALYRSTSSIARMEILVITPRSTRTLKLKAWTRGEDEALVIIEAPPREEGIATLRVGDNLWNYLPRIARTIRVPPSMMLGSGFL
jgi:hypothetical protein